MRPLGWGDGGSAGEVGTYFPGLLKERPYYLLVSGVSFSQLFLNRKDSDQDALMAFLSDLPSLLGQAHCQMEGPLYSPILSPVTPLEPLSHLSLFPPPPGLGHIRLGVGPLCLAL